MRSHLKASAAAPIGSTGLRAAVATTFIALLALVLASAPAPAATTHLYETSFGGGELTGPVQIAIDDSSGAIYVADGATNEVRKFDNDGTPADFSALGSNSLGTFEALGDGQIVVDNSGGVNDGNIYVASGIFGKVLLAFKPSGEPANFTSSAPYVSGNALSGVPPTESNPSGILARALGVAVDSSGNIYLASEGEVQVYAPDGEHLKQIDTGSGLSFGNLAIDSAGNVYVISYYSFVPGATRLTPSSLPITASTSFTATQIADFLTSGIAVDPADDNVYIDGNGSVSQFDSAANGNTRLGSFGATQLGAGSDGVAVDRSGGANDGSIFVAGGGEIIRFSPALLLPDATANGATNVTASSATLNGTVDPLGLEVTECEFEYGTSTSYGQTAPCAESSGEIGPGPGPVPVHADLSGLAPGNYHFRLAAGNANGVSQGNDSTFELIAAPVIGAQSASATVTEVEFLAELNPSNSKTTYFFEYGPTSAYGARTAEKTFAAVTQDLNARGNVAGLAPGTTYHYRLVASNAAGEVDGGDRVFTTPLPAGQQNCPNAEIRSAQGSARLPDCRAYEMVSPSQKNSSDIATATTRIRISPDGNRVVFSSAGAFAGALGTGRDVEYLAERGAGGWSTRSTTPVQSPHASLFFGHPTFMAYSKDLSKAVLETGNPPLAPGAVEGTTNLYLRDNDPNAANPYTLLNPTGPTGELFFQPEWRDSNNDLSATLFESTYPLLPEAPAGVKNLYLWKDGQLSLPSLLPGGGNVAPEGSVAGSSFMASYGYAAKNSVSEDGSRVVFGVQPEGFFGPTVIYQRDGDELHEVSAPQRPISGPDPAGRQSAMYLASNEDGSRVFFGSREKLTEDSTARQETSDLYMYEPDSEKLTDLTVSHSEVPVNVAGSNEQSGLAGLSDDGRYVYYQGNEAPDGTQGTDRFPNDPYQTRLYVWHDGVTRQVGIIGEPGSESGDSRGPYGLNNNYVTPDGKHFVFLSSTKLTTAETGGFTSIYLYDYESDELTCISCPKGSAPTADASFNSLRSQYTNAVYESTLISDDGERAIFQTATALAPGDGNGKQDVYLYENGETRLISTGRSDEPSSLAGMTPSGDDVLFATREQLSAQDKDANLDVYDARIDGGFKTGNEASAPCTDDGCQGFLSSPPVELSPGSARVDAPRGCSAVGAGAAEARRQANRLAAQAHRASGKRKARLGRKSKQQSKRAKQRQVKAKHCRAGR